MSSRANHGRGEGAQGRLQKGKGSCRWRSILRLTLGGFFPEGSYATANRQALLLSEWKGEAPL